MNQHRVLVVDQSDDLLNAFSSWLDRNPSLSVAGRARSGQEAIDLAAALAPDLVLMERVLPDMSGLEATRSIKSRPQAPGVILMCFHCSPAARTEAIAAGADDCIPKPEVTRTLIPAIERLGRKHAP